MESIDEVIKKLKNEISEFESAEVNIAFFGQPGSGKSSLINKIIGHEVSIADIKTDTTYEATKYSWNNVNLVDLPGYGTKKFSENNFLEKINLNHYDIFVCVFCNKLHAADDLFFKQIKKLNKPCLFVRNKHDDIWQDDKPIEELEKEIKVDLYSQLRSSSNKLLFTSCINNKGIDDLIFEINEILLVLEPSKQARWIAAVTILSDNFLKLKKLNAIKYLWSYSILAIFNKPNGLLIFIIPLKLYADFKIINTFFTYVRNSYGITNEILNKFKNCKNIPTDDYNKIINLYNQIEQFSNEHCLNNFFDYIFKEKTEIIIPPSYGSFFPKSEYIYKLGICYIDICHQLAELMLHNGYHLK